MNDADSMPELVYKRENRLHSPSTSTDDTIKMLTRIFREAILKVVFGAAHNRRVVLARFTTLAMVCLACQLIPNRASAQTQPQPPAISAPVAIPGFWDPRRRPE